MADDLTAAPDIYPVHHDLRAELAAANARTQRAIEGLRKIVDMDEGLGSTAWGNLARDLLRDLIAEETR